MTVIPQKAGKNFWHLIDLYTNKVVGFSSNHFAAQKKAREIEAAEADKSIAAVEVSTLENAGNVVSIRWRQQMSEREARGPVVDSLIQWGKRHGIPTRTLTELVLILGDLGVDFKQPN